VIPVKPDQVNDIRSTYIGYQRKLTVQQKNQTELRKLKFKNSLVMTQQMSIVEQKRPVKETQRENMITETDEKEATISKRRSAKFSRSSQLSHEISTPE